MLSDKIISMDDWGKLKSHSPLQSSHASDNCKVVVFTNGCFDIIHAGHVQYLEKAKELGDILIVGLNSDNSVRRLKGTSRPINNQQDRGIVLAGLSSVDYVIIFDDDTPYELIKAIQPDILVKGGDWPAASIVGNDIVLNKGGKVMSLPFWDGHSTTNILSILNKGQ